ncbi:MAG: branched-chain amino acid ABC transporter permease [Chloroflexota bacterium]|nr:branched-chain amino acid ABC transporter permease [Chloroflexota bacterium]
MIDYTVTVLITACVYAIFAMGLNLQWGFTGLLNFGHIAFMAIGAYTTVMLSIHGIPLVLAIVIGMILAGLFGLLMGIPTLRLREDFLAIVTIGFSEILRYILLNEEWLSGGAYGQGGFPRPLDDLVSAQDYKYVLLVMLVILVFLVLVLLQRLVHSPWGRVLKSVREDEEVATALGKNVFSYKIQSLILGATIAGLAGSFWAFKLRYIHPTEFVPMETFYAWIIVVLGGSGNNKGTIIGAILFAFFLSGTKFLPDIFGLSDPQMAALRLMVIGALLVVLMMFRPQGLLGKKEELSLEK